MPSVVHRRVFKLGGSYVIALPKSWVRWAKEKLNSDNITVRMEYDEDIVISLVQEEENIQIQAEENSE